MYLLPLSETHTLYKNDFLIYEFYKKVNKPVFASPNFFLKIGNESEPETPTIAEAPTRAPKTDSEMHCVKQ